MATVMMAVIVIMRLINENEKALVCEGMDSDAVKLLSPDRLQILKSIIHTAKYPAEIARELNMGTQIAYYHVRLLEKAGFIEFVEYEEKNGGVAKKYKCASDSFAIVISDNWRDISPRNKKLPRFIEPFVKHGFLEGKIVVGSPDPHGKYRARASELGVLELGMFLGRYASFSFPAYVLDTQFVESDKKGNLILAGGPKVNTVVAQINNSLPVRFDSTNSEIFSTLSKKRYSGNIGLIELVPSPFSKNSKVLLVGGLNYNGTRAAVLALVSHTRELEKGDVNGSGRMSKVVEGFDENGDGVIDAIEVLE